MRLLHYHELEINGTLVPLHCQARRFDHHQADFHVLEHCLCCLGEVQVRLHIRTKCNAPVTRDGPWSFRALD